MRRFFLLLTLVATFLVGCCTHSSFPVQNSENLAKYKYINYLQNATVALQYSEEGEFKTFCSGVWIAPTKILTAKHCVTAESETDAVEGAIIRYRTFQEMEPEIVPPAPNSHEPHYALVLATDPVSDLAIISTIDQPFHATAHIRQEPIFTGMGVHIVGHTIRLEYTYLEGIVSGIRKMDIDDSPPHKVVQISSAAFKGNSGGGAFDDNGGIVGICSFVSLRAPDMSFFVSADAINTFLEREKITLDQ